MTGLSIDRVLETSLYGTNLEEMKAFYRDVLKLEIHSQVAGRHIFFRCGQAMFLIFNQEKTSQASGEVPAHGARGAGHVAFAVAGSELEAWRAHLQEQGVEIEAEIAWPSGGRSLYFRDPAGNSVELATPQTWHLEA